MDSTKQRFKRVQLEFTILGNGRVDVVLLPCKGYKIRSQSVIVSNGAMVFPELVRKNNDSQEAWRFGAIKGHVYEILVLGALENNQLFCAYKRFAK